MEKKKVQKMMKGIDEKQRRQRQSDEEKETKILGLSRVNLVCHPSVITAPYGKNTARKEKYKGKRKTATKWKSNISRSLDEKATNKCKEGTRDGSLGEAG